jgi:hypothetical protein
VTGWNNIPAEDGNSSAWLWQQINIERKVPWTPHGLFFFFFFLQKNWFFLAVSRIIQKISKVSDLLLWQLWQAKFQWRVQSLEKLKEALWSLTSQGSKLCIYKKNKVRNGRRKISESSSATSNLFVEACCWLNDDKQKRNSNQEMAYQETLHEAQWSSSHGLLIPGNTATVATTPTYPDLCCSLERLFCLCNCSLSCWTFPCTALSSRENPCFGPTGCSPDNAYTHTQFLWEGLISDRSSGIPTLWVFPPDSHNRLRNPPNNLWSTSVDRQGRPSPHGPTICTRVKQKKFETLCHKFNDFFESKSPKIGFK